MSSTVRAHRPVAANRREFEPLTCWDDPQPESRAPLSTSAKVLVWAIVLGCMVLAFHLLAITSGGAL